MTAPCLISQDTIERTAELIREQVDSTILRSIDFESTATPPGGALITAMTVTSENRITIQAPEYDVVASQTVLDPATNLLSWKYTLTRKHDLWTWANPKLSQWYFDEPTGTNTPCYYDSLVMAHAYTTATNDPRLWAPLIYVGSDGECVTDNRTRVLTDLERAAMAQADNAWLRWNDGYWEQVVEQALTEEQKREREREQKRLKEERERANTRAKTLFLSMLDPEQLKSYHETERVIVKSATSGRRYRVHCSHLGGRHGNIEELDDRGNAVASLCCAPKGNIPHFDAMLGQIIALQFDEDEFRNVANFTPRVQGYVAPPRRQQRAA